MHAFDRRTDRILVARPRLHSMQRGKKIGNVLKVLELKTYYWISYVLFSLFQA